MDLKLADPFMRALKAVNSVSKGHTTMTEEDLSKQRKSMEMASKLATLPVGVTSTQETIEGVPCEWTRPDFIHNKKTIICYAHGGGYTSGGLSYAKILAAKLALHVGLEVVAFDYRLAPENKYPAALEDGMKVWDYLMHMGYGAENVILAGDSAGGNLVLCMAQRIIGEGRKAPKAMILFSPWTDMTATSDTYEEFKEKDPILTYDFIVSARDAYVGSEVDPADPLYSPLYGSFAGFPPTLIQVGKNELLQDDSNKLAKKIKKAGSRVTLQLYPDGWHVFQQMPTPGALTAMRAVGEWVNELLYS